MAASSSAGGYDHVADPDVPCGSTALNGKMRPGTWVHLQMLRRSFGRPDSKNASPARNTPLAGNDGQLQLDGTVRAQSPAPAAQATQASHSHRRGEATSSLRCHFDLARKQTLVPAADLYACARAFFIHAGTRNALQKGRARLSLVRRVRCPGAAARHPESGCGRGKEGSTRGPSIGSSH